MTERKRLIELLNTVIYPREGADPAEVVADFLLDNGVKLPVTCGECTFCVDMGMSGLDCEHPDNRNPFGCNPKEYCNCGTRRADNG